MWVLYACQVLMVAGGGGVLIRTHTMRLRLGFSVAEISSGKRPLGHSRPCRRSPQHAPDVLKLVLDGRVPHRHGLHQCTETALVDAELGHLLLEDQRW